MERILLALRDLKAELYHSPFTSHSLGMAYRNLADEVAKVGDANNMLASHPEDFELWRLGWYDDETGTISLKQERLLCLVDLVVKA